MTSTDKLESQIHAQDCELEYWFQQAENYAEVQIPADDLRAIIARTYAAINALPELLAKLERYDDALDEIAAHYNGGITGPGRLQADSMRDIARAALKETGQ